MKILFTLFFISLIMPLYSQTNNTYIGVDAVKPSDVKINIELKHDQDTTISFLIKVKKQKQS